MKNTIVLVVGCLMFGASVPAQERQLRGSGHLLGETAEQFYSEGDLGNVFRACQAGDWKTASRLIKNEQPASKTSAKDFCAAQEAARQSATTGARVEYKGSGDVEAMRADTFTLDGGHLVRIDMVYSAPIAQFEGYHPKSFGELFAGLQEAYGAPTKIYTEPVLNAYGVKYEAQRAIWMGKEDIISIIEQPGENGWTEIVAATLAEYDRAQKAPKNANPLR
jgi:hypothetical protein